MARLTNFMVVALVPFMLLTLNSLGLAIPLEPEDTGARSHLRSTYEQDGMIQESVQNGNAMGFWPAIPPIKTYPKQLIWKNHMQELFDKIDPERMMADAVKLSRFRNRWYDSKSGRLAGEWISLRLRRMRPFKRIHEVFEFEHDFPQSSLDVTLTQGDGKWRPKNNHSMIIVGAHFDSKNSEGGNPKWARAPGLDDNASSVGVLMEAIRVLTDFKWYNDFLNEVHFHFYAAEEIQLKGSKGLFNDYQSKGRQVMAMLNQDMSGYGPDDQKKDFFRIITDFTYKPLNEFMKLIIDEYCDIPYKEDKCGYGCSDHASATWSGYAASFVTHSAKNAPWIHTVRDIKVSKAHMVQHVKLVIAFVMELAFYDEEFPMHPDTTKKKFVPDFGPAP